MKQLTTILLTLSLISSCQSTKPPINPFNKIGKQRDKINKEKESNKQQELLRSAENISGAFNIELIQEGQHVKCIATVIRNLDSADGGSIGMFIRVPIKASSIKITTTLGTNTFNIVVNPSPLIKNYKSNFAIKFVDNLGTDGLALFDGEDIAYLYGEDSAKLDDGSYAAFSESDPLSLQTFKIGEQYTLFEFDWLGEGQFKIVTPKMQTIALKYMYVSKEPYMSFTEDEYPQNQINVINQ